MEKKYFDFEKERFEKEMRDERGFRLVYSPTLKIHLMLRSIPYLYEYERFYLVSEEECELYKTHRDSFCQKFEKEIKQNSNECFTERFAGSQSLQDYDGANGFQYVFPLSEEEFGPSQRFVCVDNVFYARIKRQNTEILVPPAQRIPLEGGGNDYPLRKNCEVQFARGGQPLCYKLKEWL
jgi:hypothetical protein